MNIVEIQETLRDHYDFPLLVVRADFYATEWGSFISLN